MSKWKKIFLSLKVFAPIVIKGLFQLWEEILDAYENENIKKREEIAELNEKLTKIEEVK